MSSGACERSVFHVNQMNVSLQLHKCILFCNSGHLNGHSYLLEKEGFIGFVRHVILNNLFFQGYNLHRIDYNLSYKHIKYTLFFFQEITYKLQFTPLVHKCHISRWKFSIAEGFVLLSSSKLYLIAPSKDFIPSFLLILATEISTNSKATFPVIRITR